MESENKMLINARCEYACWSWPIESLSLVR